MGSLGAQVRQYVGKSIRKYDVAQRHRLQDKEREIKEQVADGQYAARAEAEAMQHVRSQRELQHIDLEVEEHDCAEKRELDPIGCDLEERSRIIPGEQDDREEREVDSEPQPRDRTHQPCCRGKLSGLQEFGLKSPQRLLKSQRRQHADKRYECVEEAEYAEVGLRHPATQDDVAEDSGDMSARVEGHGVEQRLTCPVGGIEHHQCRRILPN